MPKSDRNAANLPTTLGSLWYWEAFSFGTMAIPSFKDSIDQPCSHSTPSLSAFTWTVNDSVADARNHSTSMISSKQVIKFMKPFRNKCRFEMTAASHRFLCKHWCMSASHERMTLQPFTCWVLVSLHCLGKNKDHRAASICWKHPTLIPFPKEMANDKRTEQQRPSFQMNLTQI